MDEASLKRRIMKRRNDTPSSIKWGITLTHALFLLVAVWADDSAPQSTPTLVTPTPVSRPTTNAPVVRPTSRPIAAPTGRPVTPTNKPTTKPPSSDSPTEDPTVPPSPKPVTIESVSPSMKPSILPTNQPSSTPSDSPKPTSVTISPTESPKPTLSPIAAPTRGPQSKPVQKPTTTVDSTTSPTYTPTLTPQNVLVSVDAIFSGIDSKLDNRAQEDFKTVTGDFIYYSLQQALSDDVKIVDATIDIFSQVVETQRGRRLAEPDSNDLRVRYNALIEYQSNSEDDDAVPEWVGQIFKTEDQRELYLKQLKNADSDAFDNADSVVVLVEGAEPPEVTPIDEKSPDDKFFSNENLWYIIGAVGGTISLIIIICSLYAIGRNRRRQSEITSKQNMTTATRIKNQLSYDSDMSPTNKLQYTAEIDVDLHNDDVSTLGDPTYYGGAPDQPTVAGGPILAPFSSNGGASAAQKLYHPSDPRERFLSEDDTDDNIRYSESNLSKQNDDDIVVHTVIDDSADHGGNDDNVAEDINDRIPVNSMTMPKPSGSKYAVEVPPGKLGMIIDSPDGGPPIVHTIKPESILCATVQAGDYLVSVDGETVTHMTAVQVSKLISIKSDQQRTLIFLRKPMRNRINSTSSDYFVEQNGAC